MQSLGLTRNAIKILGIYFLHNINLMNQKTTVNLLLYSWHFKTVKDEKVFY